MRLGISDADIVSRITTDPAFLGPTGKFDRLRFRTNSARRRLQRAALHAEQRRVMLRRQIIELLTGGLQVPKAWLDSHQSVPEPGTQHRICRRSARRKPATFRSRPRTSCNKYFDERKILFRAPEYRKIATVSVTPADIGAMDGSIRRRHQKRLMTSIRSRYIIPERRHVQQIVFPNAAEADAADAELKAGMTFAALAAERGLKETDIDLGTVTKSDILDPAVADAAFALKDGEVSAPMKGRFGTVIVTVLKIEPRGRPNRSPKSRRRFAPTSRPSAPRPKVQSLHDKIEDDRAGGTSLEQAAKKLNLPVDASRSTGPGRDAERQSR